tara:strand:- start:340 stop:855 length:516 start_codon:yes stop_codon:yes gene_type:complete
LKLKIYKIVALVLLGYGVFWFFLPILMIAIDIIEGEVIRELKTLLLVIAFGFILLFLGRRLYSIKNSNNKLNISLQEIPETLKEFIRRYSISTDLKNLKSNIDASSILLNILSFLAPVWGLIIFLAQNDKYPIRTKAAVKSAKNGLLIMVVIGIISILAIIIMTKQIKHRF